MDLSDTFRKSDNRKLCYFIYEESSEMASVSDTHTLLIIADVQLTQRKARGRREVRGQGSYIVQEDAPLASSQHKTRCHSPTFSFRPETC